ncbi:hypothetical protein ETH_00019725 [Eimeria tenella]|uniref:Calcineurin-like phosphoesterase domain-containing protein n=1 Tax=Eimeria tenella TaxID=5802 RepID=U6KVZ4_EIMTE|nr:hypothetical protein ETH_00019725 [Eimeria tenella]CDJ40509.1 hypothetical protein ETH_00019725 [Eimeria tenella]|eukprot:XP_013231259.1 hypothetical protein ETH_00019725 [Eimeria tenella]
MRSLPFNVLRVARGVQREEPTAAVAHLQQELLLRGVRTPRDFLLKTNFLDLLFSTSVLEEAFLQLDVLEEFVRNWEAYRGGQVGPPAIPGAPGAPGAPELLKTLSSKKTPRERAPKCPTLLCFVDSVWAQRAEHPLDRQQQQKTEKGEEVPKEPSSEAFAELQFRKTSSNFLRVVAVGNTNGAAYGGPGGPRGPWGALKRGLRLTELEDTVQALRKFHQEHNVDVALGLGDFLKPPGAFSVADEAFRTRWHDIFVRDGGLDIPWYMVNGEAEGALSSSSCYRFHYSRRDANFHNPRWLHKAVWTFAANLTTAAGAPQDVEFTVHLISIDTWTLFGGTPFLDNLSRYQSNMIALSNALFHSAKAKADWIIVQGHHPLTSTGPEAEEARVAYIEDLVKNGRPRGPEHRLVDLLTNYQVDAYISGHDHALEYVSLTDLDKNSTLAFITSGGGTRVMGGAAGRGWLGLLRGKLFPVLCWAGKRIFYKLDPGGCRPSEKDQALAYKFYAPHGASWRLSVKERVLNATGFAALQLSRDFLVVDFVDGRSGRPTGRRLHKRSNREARAANGCELRICCGEKGEFYFLSDGLVCRVWERPGLLWCTYTASTSRSSRDILEEILDPSDALGAYEGPPRGPTGAPQGPPGGPPGAPQGAPRGAPGGAPGGPKKMRVLSIVMLSPDYPLKKFVGKSYSISRRFCSFISIYGDTRDQALAFSELYNREPCMGKRLFCLHSGSKENENKNEKSKTRNSNSQQQLLLQQQQQLLQQQQDAGAAAPKVPVAAATAAEEAPVEAAAAAVPVDAAAAAAAEAAPAAAAAAATESNWLDLDVIDTTFVEGHMDFLKHSIYQANREVMDDIREVIVKGARASARRARLERRRGNVFCFRVAPAAVRSLYG